MKNDINYMQKRAVDIRDQYAKTDTKEWGIEQVFMGMIKDIGNLSKLLMIEGGYRDDIPGEVREKLEHEMSDVLYSLLVIADKLNIDLPEAFERTMNEIEDRLEK